jgi:hypothetical protein
VSAVLSERHALDHRVVAVGRRAGRVKLGSTMRAEPAGAWNRSLQFEPEPEPERAGKSESAGRAAVAPLVASAP